MLLQQRLFEADVRLASERLAASQGGLAPVYFLGQSQGLALERLAASSMGCFYPPRVTSLKPSLNLLEQNEMLRQHRLAEELLSSGVSTFPAYQRQLPSMNTSVRSQSQQSHELTGLIRDSSLFPRSQTVQPLPSLTDLSSSERARLLACHQLRVSRSQSPQFSRLMASTSTSPSDPVTLSHYESMVGRHQLLPSFGIRSCSFNAVSAPHDMEGDLARQQGAESLNILRDPVSSSNVGRTHLPSEDGNIERSSNSTAATGRRSSLPVAGQLSERLPMPKSGELNVRIPHFLHRSVVPLASEEDQNWLSEMLCFVRLDILEVFRATEDDIRSRNSSKGIRLGQVGIRCRYCAHLPKGHRAGRSASFPSSLDRIYQSLTMMLRDHFAKCSGMPLDIQQKYVRLKHKTTQGATDSKLFWVHSAKRMGLVDLKDGGIWIRGDDNTTANTGDGKEVNATANNNKVTVAADAEVNRAHATSEKVAASARPSPSSNSSSDKGCSQTSSAAGGNGNEQAPTHEQVASSSSPLIRSSQSAWPEARRRGRPTQLVFPEDKEFVSPFLCTVLSNANLVFLEDEERVGNKKSLPVGLPGLSCRHCDQSGRKGLCRVFPARRRNLPLKIYDLCDHLIKCNLCPLSVQQELQRLRKTEQSPNRKLTREERSFYADLWARMGNEVGANSA
ncbi:hypothetical protein IV203_016518 [Nitzschia inconspicua]|uniref:Uncharacterized protein n=1 Tax=Nitzschia inconspicua TaxID=303405 RepID=A0A9K3KPW6_9STRA|nr:hypothetical protein IV203_016518 [Nitzschia inconspicua]